MSETGAERLIDGRAMEPPEPFVQTMEALDVIEPGQTLLLLLAREPFPLYRALELNGIAWATRRNADGDFEIRMWRKDSAPLVVPTGVDCPDCAGQ